MTDRELLYFAAKAAGMFQSPRMTTEFGEWNPITDDSDALRLMARLNINVHYRENRHGAFVIADRHDIQVCAESLDGPHEDDATRRAIVRAAAEIGKGMK